MPAVRLNRVTIPAELDRLQMVRRIDSTRLQIDDQNRWAAPVDEMVRRVLTGDLAARLPPNSVADANESASGERLHDLAVDIQEFYADHSCAVTLRSTWVLSPAPTMGTRAQGSRSPSRQASAEIAVPSAGGCSGPQAIPEAMSQALALLSDHIAADIGALGH